VEYAAAVLLLLVLVGLVVVRPLLLRGEPERRDEARRQELEAAKEAKYREIRDAELDFRMGKIPEADWRAMDRELRAQAIEILRQVDHLGGDGHGGEQPLP
jgi:type II secretory pathway component PulM